MTRQRNVAVAADSPKRSASNDASHSSSPSPSAASPPPPSLSLTPPVVDVFDPHHLSDWSFASLAGCLLLLVLSGTLKTLTTQLASNQGASHTSSLLLIWINYFGQFAFGFISKAISNRRAAQQAAALGLSSSLPSAPPSPSSAAGVSHHRTQTLLVFIAALDVIGCTVCLIGTVLIGSGLYQVLYASILVMIALLSQAILGYKQNGRQWICLLLVTAGLWASSLVSNASAQAVAVDSAAIAANEERLCLAIFPAFVCSYTSLHSLGILLTLIGTFIYAIQSVLCELMNTSPSFEKVSAGELNGKIGWYGLFMSTVYVLFYTFPRWTELVSEPMAAKGLGVSEVGIVLGGYLLANVFHRVAYWSVVAMTGSIFAGLSNALRTVAVFFLSSLLFCCPLTAPQQCVTTHKTIAAGVVVVGVVLYQLNTSKQKGGGPTVPVRVHGAGAMIQAKKQHSSAASQKKRD